MSETAVLDNHDIDPAHQAVLSMPYETARGVAYNAINPRTGEVIQPQEGINIEVLDQWAAEEVAAEIGGLETYLLGEGDQESTLESTVNNLSYLSMLYLSKDHVDAIAARSAERGDGGWRWKPETTADAVAHDQLKILSEMTKGNDALSHSTSFGAPLLASGALKPKAGHDEYRTFSGDTSRLRNEGTQAVKDKIEQLVEAREWHRNNTQNPNAGYNGYIDQLGLHSQLVHFGEADIKNSSDTNFYYPRSAVMKRTPIAMIGQDSQGSTGVPGIKSRGDEAFHGKTEKPKRDRFAEVRIDLSPEISVALTPRKHAADITFMAATDSAERAVDFEYPIEESVMFVNEYDMREYIAQVAVSDETDSIVPKSVREAFAFTVDRPTMGERAGEFDLASFVQEARAARREMAEGISGDYSTPRAEAFWNDIVRRMNTIIEDMEQRGLDVRANNATQVVETALLRRVLEAQGHDPEWTNSSVFMSARGNDELAYDTYALQTARAVLQSQAKDTYFIQAKAEDLQFDQVDLAMQLPVYKN